jgi:hypothetical protein
VKKVFLAILSLIVLVVSVFAQGTINQNMKGKVGLGFNASFSDIPALAGRYWLTDAVGLECFTGFKTGKNEDVDSFTIGGKLLSIIKSYKNLNLLTTTTLGLDTTKYKKPVSSDTHTYFRFLICAGVEWFVLDNLSLSTEMGFRFTAGDGAAGFATAADRISDVSVKFYL